MQSSLTDQPPRPYPRHPSRPTSARASPKPKRPTMQVERRRNVNGATSASKAKVTLEDLLALEAITVESPPFPADAAGCSGVSVSHLLGKATAGVGVFIGDDETEKIDYEELAKGVLLTTSATGAPLSLDDGGPLRCVFPVGVALQEDDSPADVRDVRLLTLTT